MLQNGYCNGAVTWSSSNLDVADVDSSGVVHATAVTGTTVITATAMEPTLGGGAPLTGAATISVSNSGGALVTIQ